MLCSTCHKLEAPAGRYLCVGCHAAYMREYRATTQPTALRQAEKQGQEIMRAAIILAFSELGDRHFNGWTAQAIVRELSVG